MYENIPFKRQPTVIERLRNAPVSENQCSVFPIMETKPSTVYCTISLLKKDGFDFVTKRNAEAIYVWRVK